MYKCFTSFLTLQFLYITNSPENIADVLMNDCSPVLKGS